MISNQQYLHALVKECNICKHLHSKFPEGSADFRPTPGQRSTTELLRYLSVCGVASLTVMLNDSDWKLFRTFTARVENMTFEEFPETMDRQIEEIKTLYASIPEADFTGKIAKHPNGEEMQLGEALIRMTYSWMVAYRMQLFLYAKQCGAHDLKTSDNWFGVSPAPAKS